MKIEDEYQQKWAALQAEYEQKQVPFLTKRAEVLKQKPEKESESSLFIGCVFDYLDFIFIH